MWTSCQSFPLLHGAWKQFAKSFTTSGLSSKVLKSLLSSQIRSIHHSGSLYKQQPPWNILFFGTDDFALPHIAALNANRLSEDGRVVNDLKVVVPGNKKPCPVKQYAKDSGLQCLYWPNVPLDGDYDVGVVTSFGHLLPKSIINSFPHGILNVHPSLLPRWRGASPIVHTILAGETQTGISIMRIQPKQFDVGPLVVQERFTVPENCTTAELTAQMGYEGARLLINTLEDLESTKQSQRSQAHDESVTYAHKLHIGHAHVDWVQQDVQDVWRQYRALGEMFSLRSEWLGSAVRLQDMRDLSFMKDVVIATESPDPELAPGTPYYCKRADTLCIKCKEGWAGFGTVVFKKPMSAKAFYNGYLSKSRNIGEVFTSIPNKLNNYWKVS